MSKINNRNAVTIFKEDDAVALTFLKPFSGEHENHLIVAYEDAYGDYSNGMLHKNTIQERHSLDDETINNIFEKLTNGINQN